MEKLIELHELIKSHPYRINEDDRYLKSYKKLLYTLADEFYTTACKSKYKNATNMIHDFKGAIWDIGTKDRDDSGAVIHVERCIGTIHKFIDTNKIESYWTNHRRYNTYELPRTTEFIWDEDENKFFPCYTEEELNKTINWIISKQTEEPQNKKIYQDMLDGVKELKEHWYGKDENE